MQSLFKVFGTAYHVETDNNKVMELPLKEGDEVLDLYEDLLFAPDNYLHHWFAAKNVQAPAVDLDIPKNHIEYALSMHHSVSIFNSTDDLGAVYPELAVDHKLSGLMASPTEEGFIRFIHGFLDRLF